MVQHLRTCTALVEALSSAPSSPLGDTQCPINTVQGNKMPFSGLCGDCTHVHEPIFEHTHVEHYFKVCYICLCCERFVLTMQRCVAFFYVVFV